MYRWVFIFVIPLVALVFMMASACQPEQPDDARLKQAVGQYLAEHPEIIRAEVERVARESRPQAPYPSLGVGGYPQPPKGKYPSPPGAGQPPAFGPPPQREQVRQLEPPIEELIKNRIKVELNNAPTMGPKDAPITIVEFADFQSGLCRMVTPILKQILKDYEGKIRLAFRHDTVSIRPHALSAAKASLAAHEQGKFWEMHDKLFENQKDLSDAKIGELAKGLGLNMKKFEEDWKSSKFDAQIQEDTTFLRSHKLFGKPTLLINGVEIRRVSSLKYIKQVLDKLLEEIKG